MKEKIKRLIVPTTMFALFLAIGVWLQYPNFALGNPSFFGQQTSTASATTTKAYMTPGRATTTLVVNSFLTAPEGNDRQTLLVQFTGSSTASKLGIAFQFSQDGINYYDDSLSLGFAASTTLPIGLGVADSFVIPMATSTTGLEPFASTPISGSGWTARAIDIPTPARYTKVVFSMPFGGGNVNGAVWATVIPKKQLR